VSCVRPTRSRYGIILGAEGSHGERSRSIIHPVSGQGDAALTDRDVAVYGLKAGCGVRGASLGSHDGEAAAFRKDISI
jgi:hypothetical protein